MTGEPITLEVHGSRLAGLVWGPPEGKPVLALHGWLDNAASFSRLAPLLPELRIVALDLPGHGHSEWKPPGVHYHFIDWVADVAAVADVLGWDHFALLGHSMGAAVASLLAGTIPERIGHMALIEGLGPLSCEAHESPQRLAKSIARRGLRERKQPRRHLDRETAAQRVREVNPALSEEGARLIVERGTKKDGDGVTWRSDPRLRGTSPMRMTEAHVRAFLRRVTAQCLLVRAHEGYVFDENLAAGRLACLRNATVHDVPGGHHVHLDDPERIAGILAPFFASSPAPVAAPTEAPARWPGVTADSLRIVKGIKLVVFDVDGVLTPGRVSYQPGDGKEATAAFYIRDGMGIKMLERNGVNVALLSGRASEAVAARAAVLGIRHVHLGVEQKLPRLKSLAAELGVDLLQVAYMGDDVNDLPCLRAVGLPSAPADAHEDVRRAAQFLPRNGGGAGAARELAEHILKAQGSWQNALDHYEAG